MKYSAVAAALALFLSGCTMGPNYKRPSIAMPEQFRAAQVPAQAADSIAETKWSELFPDDNLRQIVSTALENNFDLRAAAERVQQARAQLGIVRANQFPFFNGQAQWNATRASTLGSLPFIAEGTDLKFAYTQAGVGASWDLDLWGRLRRLTESARAQYLATEENRLALRVSLVGDVMNTYFTLLEQDLELEIGRQTQNIAEDGLRLVKIRRDRGAATGLDVHQAEQLLYLATAQIAGAQRAIEQTENALNLLLGQTPSGITRGMNLWQIPVPAQLPAGLPAALIARRPDVRQAEQVLISANAEIGAARALYFPQISLTAFFGGQSRALRDLFTNAALMGNVAPSAVLPIFHAGQIRNNVRLTEAQQREMLIRYQQTIYGALRDVSDALVAHQRTTEQRDQQQLLVTALAESSRLSRLRYEGGLDSYLQVLDAQRNQFQGELVLAQLRLLELQSIVRLYSSLGGGWQ
jgi:multidrug efflux system outer membrane protein